MTAKTFSFVLLLFICGEMAGFISGWKAAVNYHHIDVGNRPNDGSPNG